MDELLDEIERYVRYCVDTHAHMPAIELIGSKWLIRVLFHLCRHSPRRFGELRRIIRAHDARDDARAVDLDQRVLEVLEGTVDGRVEERSEKRLLYAGHGPSPPR